MKIVADDKIPFLKGVFEPFAEVIYLPGDKVSNSALKNADALLTRSITRCDEALLSGTSVKFIATATIGDDHIDKNYCVENGIQWSTAKGCNAEAVNQYIQAALIAVSRIRDFGLSGKTMAVIGAGNIGSRVQKTAELLGLKCLLYDPPRARNEKPELFSSLHEIRQNADIVTLHVPLTFGGQDKTYHLVDSDFIDGFSKQVLVLNTSRGAVAETGALKGAVVSGKISGLVLDVWENEPVLDPELLDMADIATPHIAGYSLEGKITGTAMTVQSVSRFFHLGLESWVPLVQTPLLHLQVACNDLTTEALLNTIFETVYPILADSNRLKEHSDEFEEIRRSYSFRNENQNYILDLKGCSESFQVLAGKLGFRLPEK